MPSESRLNVLALNASLKHEPEVSNTGELASLVLDEIRALAPIDAEVVRLSDALLPVGLRFREASDDDWPGLVTKIKAADVVLLCTPIWWGGRSSLMQRLIERFDALDEEYSATGRSAIKGKVAGIVITGSEDGALSVMGSIMMVMSWMGFTLPPNVRRIGWAKSDNPLLRIATNGSGMARRCTWQRASRRILFSTRGC
jgi:multimeric flavodoxin WrbA